MQIPFDTNKDPLILVINAAGERAPVFDLRKLPEFIRQSFRGGSAVLLIDGFDEADPQKQNDVVAWFKALMDAYPKARIVTTGTPNQLNGLIGLGFHPLALAAWEKRTVSNFIQRWGEAWTRTISQGDKARENLVDAILIHEWLGMENAGLTPLELTLKAWGAYAGDSLGARVLDFIATHVRRVAPTGTPVAALELLAMQVVFTSQPVFDPRKARSWVKQYEKWDGGSACNSLEE